MTKFRPFALSGMIALALAGALGAAPAAAVAADYRNKIGNDLSRCAAGNGPAMLVTVNGITKPGGTIRIQSYRATQGEWLVSGKWLARIETPARGGSMKFCLPLPGPGSYGIAVRHDVNNNGETDISTDGGAMSNNPSLNIFNLGKPSYKKTAVAVGNAVQPITITMRYR